MKFYYKPKSSLEKFGEKVYFLLVENFYPTFYVGGMVRDLLLGRVIKDIDIATAAKPEQVAHILAKEGITVDGQGKSFGVIRAVKGEQCIEVTTFRKDTYDKTRYPKVSLITTPKADSKRRDFTINSLYLSLKSNEILDFYGGLGDIRSKRIKFIGKPEVRIKEDPLRIARAARFALELNFRLEETTAQAIKKYLYLIGNLSKSRLEAEIKKLNSLRSQKILRKFLYEAGDLTLSE